MVHEKALQGIAGPFCVLQGAKRPQAEGLEQGRRRRQTKGF